MTGYLFSLLFIILFSFSKKGYEKVVSVFYIVFFLSLFTAVRSFDLGADTRNYENIYNIVGTFPNFYRKEAFCERGFQLLCCIIKSLGFSYRFFLFFFSFLTLLLFNIAVFRISPNHLIFSNVVYYCRFFLAFNFNVLRQGFVCSVLFLAVSYLIEKKYLKYFLLMLFSACFHKSTLLLLPVFPFAMIKYKNWEKGLFFVIAIYFGYVIGMFRILQFFVPSFKYVFNFYAREADAVTKITIGFILNIITYFVIERELDDQKDTLVLKNILLISVLFQFLFFKLSVFTERYCTMMNVSLCFLLPKLAEKLAIRHYVIRYFIYTIFILYLLLFFKQGIFHHQHDYFPYYPYAIAWEEIF